MYLFHQREASGRSNFGWLRSTYHSVIQQVIRRDPVYYMWYTYLRTDHPWQIISYPYYAKYAKSGDRTKFRHIDTNVPQAIATGRGVDMIQGSVSFDEEYADDCTELLLGLHHHLDEWWDRVKERGLDKDGYVHSISSDMWTKDDLRHFGINWINQP